MDKTSAFVWKTARRQVRDLPPCPADLTEPEYANLVFYARCHVRTHSLDGLNSLRCRTGLWKIHTNYSLEYTPQVLFTVQNKAVRFPIYFATGKFTERKVFAVFLPVIR